MSLERGQQFLRQLAGVHHDLPFSPKILQRLFSQTGQESTASLHDIAETIAPDQGLTTRLLAVANSAFYGLQSQVTSVHRAATVLGIKDIRNIVMAVGVHGMLKGYTLPEELDLLAYWRHQLTVGQTAFQLAAEAGRPERDNLFTAGLLHDLGKLIVAMHAPGDWLAIERLRQERGIPYRKAEDAYWGLEHGVVGALVLKSWDLPPDLHEPINWHHSPLAAPDYRQQALFLCLADMLVNLESGGEPVPEKAADALSEHLGLPFDRSQELARDAAADEGIDQFISEVMH
ncbi:putative signal transduction protein [Desulfovibrio sp. X2]|uniref:HDOD domain-containing protein n=1 Tax=Desulfovibrio sp. X2 TaxID=941449 RepID=UPI0003589779|nr:HDOD domain-containing protein [Desulfovibrio sp. X2]EPR41447.1 putative signal transduction protein [Desulfovibrio sp. X2]